MEELPPGDEPDLPFPDSLIRDVRAQIPLWDRKRQHEIEVLEELEELENRYAENYVRIAELTEPALADIFRTAAAIQKPFDRGPDELLACAVYRRLAAIDDSIMQMGFTVALARRWHVWLDAQRILYMDGRINDIRDNPLGILQTVMTLRGRKTAQEEAERKEFKPQ